VAAAVVAERVGRDYGAVCAVSDLSFEVGPGDVVGVLGRNGAGKTTSIRVLTTILAPTRGRFAVAEVPHTGPDEIRRRIGVLPEAGGYPARQTGEEHLVYHARLRGASRASARAAAAALLEEFGLADGARRPARGAGPRRDRGCRRRAARRRAHAPAARRCGVSRGLAVAVAVTLALAWPGAARASVSVTVDRTGVATGLGKRFAFRSTVVNAGPGEARGLVAHLNVASLRPGVYVDPEDWSTSRTR
jgi:ABC-type taurine transport system ATPase subunit